MQDPKRAFPENLKMFHVEHFSPPSHFGLFLSCYSLLRPLKHRLVPLPRTTFYQAGSRRVGGTTKVNIRSLYDINAHCAPATHHPDHRKGAHSAQNASPLPLITLVIRARPGTSRNPSGYLSVRHGVKCDSVPLAAAPDTRGARSTANRADKSRPTFPPIARPVINQSASCLPRGRAPRIAESPPAPASRIPRAVAACAPPAEIR